jgi:HSP20 family protein
MLWKFLETCGAFSEHPHISIARTRNFHPTHELSRKFKNPLTLKYKYHPLDILKVHPSEPNNQANQLSLSIYMQPLRTIVRNAPKALHRISKPTTKPATRTFTTTLPTMSLFPRFTSEFGPLFRLMDDYDRRVFRDMSSPSNDNSSLFRDVRSFTPKFDVRERGDVYELHGEFPGVEQKNISIEWSDANTLTVSGRHEVVWEEGTKPAAAAIENSNGKNTPPPAVEDGGDAASSQVSKTSTSTTTEHQHQDVATKNNNDDSVVPAEPKYWVSERSVGEFHRSFSFPARVDQDAVKASLRNGILSVVVPKARAARARKVDIDVE